MGHASGEFAAVHLERSSLYKEGYNAAHFSHFATVLYGWVARAVSAYLERQDSFIGHVNGVLYPEVSYINMFLASHVAVDRMHPRDGCHGPVVATRRVEFRRS